jgi:hypothetical protein
MERWPDLRVLAKDRREFTIDKAEDKLEEAVDAGEGWAIKFTLATVGKRRGYVERQEHTGADGGPMVTEHTVPLDRLSPALRRQIVAEIEALEPSRQLKAVNS